MQEYLKLPVRFENFFEKKKLATCNLLDSIYRNLHLIITTVPGENKIDDYYGAAFWDHDYDIHLTNDARKEIIVHSLKNQIKQYEKRITNVELLVNVSLSTFKTEGNEIQRRKIEIMVKGKILRSLEPFTFQTGFYIGPLTLD